MLYTCNRTMKQNEAHAGTLDHCPTLNIEQNPYKKTDNKSHTCPSIVVIFCDQVCNLNHFYTTQIILTSYVKTRINWKDEKKITCKKKVFRVFLNLSMGYRTLCCVIFKFNQTIFCLENVTIQI